MMSHKFLVGVDGGASQTRAVVCNAQGQIYGRGVSGSSNFYAVGMEKTADNIASAIQQATAGLDSPVLESCGLGLAGACSPGEIAGLSSALRPRLAPFFDTPDFPFAIDEDAVAAWAGAFGGAAGVICIAGTGANAFGIGLDGARLKADGIGPLLGDRGGGIDIGRDVLRAASAAYDTVGPATTLFDAVLAHFGLDSMDGLINRVYAPEFARSELAALVPVAAREAAQGDAVAQNILHFAGSQLAASVASVLRRLNLKGDQPTPVAPVGGVLENVDVVRASFEAELAIKAPYPVVVQVPRFEPVVGAALLPQIWPVSPLSF